MFAKGWVAQKCTFDRYLDGRAKIFQNFQGLDPKRPEYSNADWVYASTRGCKLTWHHAGTKSQGGEVCGVVLRCFCPPLPPQRLKLGGSPDVWTRSTFVACQFVIRSNKQNGVSKSCGIAAYSRDIESPTCSQSFEDLLIGHTVCYAYLAKRNPDAPLLAFKLREEPEIWERRQHH